MMRGFKFNSNFIYDFFLKKNRLIVRHDYYYFCNIGIEYPDFHVNPGIYRVEPFNRFYLNNMITIPPEYCKWESYDRLCMVSPLQ
jgi:hypothetical protein